jgi:hypothetical protein
MRRCMQQYFELKEPLMLLKAFTLTYASYDFYAHAIVVDVCIAVCS